MLDFNPNHVREEGGVAGAGNTATATHAAAAVTYAAAGPGISHGIYGVAWSYSGGTPAGGSLTIADGATTVFQLDVTAAGAGFVSFPAPLIGSTNAALTITLADGGGGIVGKVNALGHFTGRVYPRWAMTEANFSNPDNSGLLAVI